VTDTKTRAGGQSLPGNVQEAVRLCWRAAPGLLLAVMAVPLFQSALIGIQLLVVRSFADRLLEPDSAARDDVLRSLFLPAVFILAALVGVAVLDNVQTIVRELLTERVRRDAARRMHTAIGALELIDFERPETHDRVMRASSTDFRPAQAVRALTAIAGTLMRSVVLVGFVVVIVPLLLALAIPVLIVSNSLASDRYKVSTRLTPLERRRLYFNRMLTAREPAAETRAYGLADHFGRRYDELSAQRETELRGMLRRQWRRMLGSQLVFALVAAGSLAMLGWLYSSGRADAAALITAGFGIVQVAALIGALGFPITELTEAGLFLGDQRVFLREIELAATRRPAVTGAPVPPLASIELHEVTFSYPSGDHAAVEKVSLRVERGQIIAFVGANGSGKTTLAKVVGALFDPDAGQVCWNGVDVRDLDRSVLRTRIASVFQDYQTFSETIADNVAFGMVSRTADRERVDLMLRQAGFDPGELDLDLLIGPEHEGGTALSGGQQQRLAIARALYRDADLLLLDEPTSALDARAEHQLISQLRHDGRTTIVISHRLANIADADRIFVFSQGRVVEEGDHAELMAASGLYHELYTLQASLYEHAGAADAFSFGPTGEQERGNR